MEKCVGKIKNINYSLFRGTSFNNDKEQQHTITLIRRRKNVLENKNIFLA